MKIKYYKSTDSLYIEFTKGKYEKSRKVSSSVMVDEDKKGNILGIEVLDAKKNLPKFDPQNVKLTTQSI